jgi:hypothetical protein
VKGDEPACDEVQLRFLERGEESAHLPRGKHLQMRRVVLRIAAGEEAQPVLQPIGVRNGGDERTAGAQDASRLRDEPNGIAEMLEQFAGDDDVEARVLESQRLVEIGPSRLDPGLLRLGERLTIGIDADDFVACGIGASKGTVTAAEVEDALAGATDVAAEELDSLGSREDESRPSLKPVVFGVAFAEAF